METTHEHMICKKCSGQFPKWITVDGRKKDLRRRQYCLKCSPYGQHNTRHLDKWTIINGLEYRRCSVCNQFYHMKTRRYSGWCNSCRNLKRQEQKKQAVEYKGGACQDCGGIFPLSVYDFHHLDPNQKDFEISKVRPSSLAKVKAELDKCVLLCSNCHRIRHSNID